MESRHAKLRGKGEDSEPRHESGPPPVPKSAQVVSGRRHHRLRMLVDHLMCRDGRSEESLVERRVARTLAAPRNCQTALGTFLKFVKERALPLVEDVKIDGSAGCVLERFLSKEFSIIAVRRLPAAVDGSLAVIQPLWVQETAEVPSMFEVWQQLTPARTRRAMSASLGRHRNTTHPPAFVALRKILPHRLRHFSLVGRS